MMPAVNQGCETYCKSPTGFRMAAFHSPSLQQPFVPAQHVCTQACQSPAFLLQEVSRGGGPAVCIHIMHTENPHPSHFTMSFKQTPQVLHTFIQTELAHSGACSAMKEHLPWVAGDTGSQ